MKNFFDLHVHPSSKPFLLSADPASDHNCWEFIGNVKEADRSQSCLDQLRSGGVNLAVAALYTLEKPLLNGRFVEQSFPAELPVHQNYLDLLKGEIRHLEKSRWLDPASGRSFRLLQGIDDYRPDQMNLILALDGSHSLTSDNQCIVENLHRFKTQSGYRFLYVTLAQKTRLPLASHAYSLPRFSDRHSFKPAGFGLAALGRKMIDLAYCSTAGSRTLVDIRHLSLVSRVQFYRYRREKGYQHIPILASHTGVTGLSWQPEVLREHFQSVTVQEDQFVEVRYLPAPGIGTGSLRRTNFNPWSANLYREDIVEILASGGLIGLSMDQNSLGVHGASGEFFSIQEFNFVLSGLKDREHVEPVTRGVDPPVCSNGKDVNEVRHLRHLCNNILYIVKVGGEEAWKHMCLGSDFDGLIDPINFCPDASEYPKLEEGLLEMLPQMMAEDTSYGYDETNLEQKVRSIMYDNALAFLHQHFR